MSRYLELSVEGTAERVGERALRAFKRIGKVTDQDAAASQIAGVIKVYGEPADVRISWKSGQEGRMRIEIAATSYDTLSQAADSALYAYARSYKAVGWHSAPADSSANKKRQRYLIGGAIAAALLLTLVLGFIVAARYSSVR